MMGLVDYASDSESGSDESGDEGLPTGVLIENPIRGISAPITATTLEEKSEAFSIDDAGSGDEVEDVVSGGSLLGLPAARPSNRGSDRIQEHEIEEIAKPKEWEKKLAEKARRKLEKKAAKRAEKQKRKEAEKNARETKDASKKKRGPVRIDAFGALNKDVIDEKGEKTVVEQEVPVSSAPIASSSLKLFSMLPPPKTASRTAPFSKGSAIMIPSSLRAKSEVAKAESSTKQPIKPIVSGADSSDDDGDGDFFSLASSDKERSAQSGDGFFSVPGVPMLPSYGLSEEAGPTRRAITDDDSYGYEAAEEADSDKEPSTSANIKTISDEAAQNLIFKHDYAPFGYDRRGFNEANIVDVSVDNAIGPNVQENLLKNLNRHNMARASMPTLPATVAPKDKNAKRKHQITYLANIAVAREEELQQKWAEGKAAKRMARQKYGF